MKRNRIFLDYIYNCPGWPKFYFDSNEIIDSIIEVKYLQGIIKGYLRSAGFVFRDNTALDSLTSEVLKSSEIEGENLNREDVRSSVAKHLGLEIGGLKKTDRYVDGVVQMVLDATQNYKLKLTEVRLCKWHKALFPSEKNNYKMVVGSYRTDAKGPMQVVSGAIGREKIHFEAPSASKVPKEMKQFLKWFNADSVLDPVIKAAIAHLWFLTIHPFSDGNGRIARALTDLMLTRGDNFPQRFYSMSAEIRNQHNSYYEILEYTQKGPLDISKWIEWFLQCLKLSLKESERKLKTVMDKTNFWDHHKSTEINERQRKIINLLFDGFTGKLNSSKWAKINKCSSDTALRDIQDLMSKKILVKEEGGGRSTAYKLG